MSVSSIDLQGIDVLSDSLSFLGDDYQSMFDDGIVRSALFVPRADQLLTEMQIWRARTEHSTQGMLVALINFQLLTIHKSSAIHKCGCASKRCSGRQGVCAAMGYAVFISPLIAHRTEIGPSFPVKRRL